MSTLENVPVDLLQPILIHLPDRRHLSAAALVSRAFNRAATPLLYRRLDSQVKHNVLHHPSATLLKRPELAQYVWHVTETGAVQQVIPNITEDIVAALRLCKNLTSATWVDDTLTPEANFLPILDVLVTLPLRELTIRTQYDPGERVWARLNTIQGIRRLSVWSLEWGPPRVLQGWADLLSSSLTHLELCRCAGVPATILISVFMKLPLLQELCLKGAPSAAIPAIIACLPNLIALDAEYLGSGNYRSPLTPLPRLQRLTVRAGSVDILGPQKLWTWMRALLPHQQTLKSFTLNAFAVQGQMTVPRPFIMNLTARHGISLQEFAVGVAQVTLEAVSHMCSTCPQLELLECSVASSDVDMIARAIEAGRNLQTLKLHVSWIADGSVDLPPQYDKFFTGPRIMYTYFSHPASDGKRIRFTEEQARALMLQTRLRNIGIGDQSYIGRWVRRECSAKITQDIVQENVVFEVVGDVTDDPFI
ncbi:uncharacterized protein EDB91DRAFT_183771 [Suillus paluster]|uniref:uncharacterized protein n=1 Tax=Suillus paluster TaxID=48578 RepID=UPI001B877FDE|nr:uncharacterized protein EDB91DRAFT_183771 [Suillus paluster]KAG1723125.1 hypothetical protein EDB91DRAFT_183771 [Suillus paluster]